MVESTLHQYPGLELEIGLGNVLGDEALFKEILQIFYQQHYKDLVEIPRTLQSGDINQFKHLVHTLKGISGSIGAMALFAAARDLDSAINHQQHQDYHALTDMLLAQLNLVIDGIAER